MPKFEEDLILNNIPDENEEEQDFEEEEYFHDYYEYQLINDLSIKILLEWRKYCQAVGINMSEKMNVEKIKELLCINEE